jgi:hypothetical protein
MKSAGLAIAIAAITIAAQYALLLAPLLPWGPHRKFLEFGGID